MSASDLNPETTNSSLRPASQEATPLDVANQKGDLEPRALELLCEFFQLLDHWDQPEGR